MNTLTVYIKYLPAEVQILSVSVYNQSFEVKRLLKIGNTKNDLRLILKHSTVKNTPYMYILCTHTRGNPHN